MPYEGILDEFGQIALQGVTHASKLIAFVESLESERPIETGATLQAPDATLAQFEIQIGKLGVEFACVAKKNGLVQRLMTASGMVWLIATAITALSATPENICKAQNFHICEKEIKALILFKNYTKFNIMHFRYNDVQKCPNRVRVAGALFTFNTMYSRPPRARTEHQSWHVVFVVSVVRDQVN